jgi:hypothetical protein
MLPKLGVNARCDGPNQGGHTALQPRGMSPQSGPPLCHLSFANSADDSVRVMFWPNAGMAVIVTLAPGANAEHA